MNPKYAWRLVPAIAAMMVAGQASANYGFEDLNVGLTGSVGFTENGVNATLGNTDGVDLDIYDLSFSSGPPSFGSRTVWTNGSVTPTLMNLSMGVNKVTIDFGDYGADDDSIFLRAYSGLDGSGSVLDFDTFFYAGSESFPDDVVTLSVSSMTPIYSLELGSVGYNSENNIFVDNVRFEKDGVSTVPGPLAALPFALGFLARRRRKQA